jgi:hypothetical protein
MNILGNPPSGVGDSPIASPYHDGYRKGFMDGEMQGFKRGLEEGRKLGEQIGRHSQIRVEKKPRKARNTVAGPYTPQFEQFWDAFPRDMRGTKMEAWMEWAKAAPNELLFDEMLGALKKQVAAYEAGAAGKGPFFPRLKHACRWIKYQGWDMDVPAPFVGKSNAPNRPELG